MWVNSKKRNSVSLKVLFKLGIQRKQVFFLEEQVMLK